MSHRKRIEDQFSSKKNKGLSHNLDVDDYQQLENLDLSGRTDAQLDNLMNDLGSNSQKPRKQRSIDDEEEEDERYVGKAVSRSQLFANAEDEDEDDDDENGSLMEDEDDEDDENDDEDVSVMEFEEKPEPKSKVNGTAKGKKAKANTNKAVAKKNIDEINIDDILEDLDKQDAEVFKDVQKDTKELEKAKNVQNQAKLWDGIVESRVTMQSIFKLANQLPQDQVLEHYKQETPELKNIISGLQVELVDLIDLMDNLFEESATKSSMTRSSSTSEPTPSKSRTKAAQKHLTKLKINRDTFMKDFEFDTEAIWNDLDTQFLSNHPKIEETINTFSQRFNLMNTSSLKGKFLNIFQTPVQQAQKMMDDYPRLLQRSQLKEKDMKVLGAINKDKDSEYDEEIYNDTEFYMQLYKEMMSSSTVLNKSGDDLLTGDTQAYLKQRLLRTKMMKPDVDRRASKARKLRYEAHPKLMNFMTPSENIKLLVGREDLLKNLFGIRQQEPEQETQNLEQKQKDKALLAKKKKKVLSNGKNKNTEAIDEEEEDNILLF